MEQIRAVRDGGGSLHCSVTTLHIPDLFRSPSLHHFHTSLTEHRCQSNDLRNYLWKEKKLQLTARFRSANSSGTLAELTTVHLLYLLDLTQDSVVEFEVLESLLFIPLSPPLLYFTTFI